MIKQDILEKQAKTVYLGIGSRGKIRKMDPKLFEFLWNGKIVTFDKPYWRFEVVNGSRRFN